MKVYNSYTKRKEEFVPLHGNDVKMYACGITVSGEAHIGHGYQALIYDIMRKFLKKRTQETTRTSTIKLLPNRTKRAFLRTNTRRK